MKHLKEYKLWEQSRELTTEQEGFLNRYVRGTWGINSEGLVGRLAERYNLLYFDLENGFETLLKLPQEWKDRNRVNYSVPPVFLQAQFCRSLIHRKQLRVEYC